MDLLLAMLLILLGIALWILAGLLPVLELAREDGKAVIAPQLTWMGALTLWQRRVTGVRGARFVNDPQNPKRSRVELRTADGYVALTGPYVHGMAPARMAQVIDRFAHDRKVPPAKLPLRGRLHLMTGFAIFFPLGTVAIFVATLLLLR